jgi:hypothetical protein
MLELLLENATRALDLYVAGVAGDSDPFRDVEEPNNKP